MNSIQAKNIKIADYLQNIGIHPQKRSGANYWYYSPFRQEQTPSFKVDNQINVWYDHGIGKGGNIIDLVMQLHNISDFKEALQYLSKNEPPKYIDTFFFQQQVNSSITIKEVKPVTNPILIDYIKSRKIDIELAELYCKDVYYQVNNRNYFSVGFKNDNGGYELSNVYGKISSPPKDITTFKSQENTCIVFEGFFDYLSYLMSEMLEKAPSNVVVLNSTANLSKAIQIIASHKEVQLFLDNDKGGRDATKAIQSVCNNAIDKSIQYKEYNDLNDYLCGKKLEKQIKKAPSKGFRR